MSVAPPSGQNRIIIYYGHVQVREVRRLDRERPLVQRLVRVRADGRVSARRDMKKPGPAPPLQSTAD